MPPALVRSVKVVTDKNGPAVEIITTRPMIPVVSTLVSPSRLVIDLPKSYVSPAHWKIDFSDKSIGGVRVNQYQKDPPATRIVVDLKKPCGYSWDAAGNRLMIRMQTSLNTAIDNDLDTSPAAPAATSLVPVSPSRATVSHSGAGTGSSLTAGADTAVLHLPRGGEVRVCPGTTVSVTYSQNSRDLMLSMNTGAMEAHYSLDASADSVLTPDFRILLAGPGEFDYAISADPRGNTCVRSLPGSTASAIVSELMGDGTYQVKPSQQVVFHQGRLTAVDHAVPPNCGCPEPTVPTMLASSVGEPQANAAGSMSVPVTGAAPAESQNSEPASPQVGAAAPGDTTLPPADAKAVHVQVDAPFVFRAADAPRTVPPAPTEEVSDLKLQYATPVQPVEMSVVAPPRPEPTQKEKPEHKGFFGKIGGFFSSIFH